MDFSMSAAAQELTALTRTITADLVDPAVPRAADESGGHSDKLWRALADAGVIAAATPQPGTQDGLGVQEQCAVLTELGQVLAPVPLRATTVAGAVLARFGDAGQQRRWLEPALTGDVILAAAPALTGLGGPATSALTADPLPGGDGAWELNGTYDLLTAGMIAGLVVADVQIPDGSALFVIDVTLPGVTLTPQQAVNGSGAASLELRGVRLSDGDRLDGDTTGHLLALATVAACAEQTGVLAGGLEVAAAYTRTLSLIHI